MLSFPRATVACLIVAGFVLAEPLPVDPALVTGELDNGLRYVIRQHSNPAGRANMWIQFHTGSLNETDRQRGIAHYLEHMAFNGSENFPPGSLIPFFQSLGMTFGRDQNAFTSFDQTTYQLTLPDTKPETIARGMTFFSDVAGKLLLRTDEIDAERQIIQEERRQRLSGRQRAEDYVLERLTPGSIVGRRLPIGTEETINSVNQADFRDYYEKWYTASNATVIVVADAEPEVIVQQIQKHFADLPKRERPIPQELNVRAYDQSFAIVASDPEIRGGEVRIARIAPARPPVTTVQQFRDELVQRIGQSAFNDRISDKIAAGGTSYQSLRAAARNNVGVMWSADVVARVKDDDWKSALESAALELQRARKFGFSSREIEDVKKELLAAAERAVETEPTVQASQLIRAINSNVANGEPTMSPTQRLELLRKLLPTITAEEVKQKFADEFDPTHVAFVAVLPAGGNVPSESDLLGAGQAALSVTPTPEVEVARATHLLDRQPTPGRVAELQKHEASQVYSAWLDNNVRLHYRFMEDRRNDVSVNISLIGGELLETAGNRGITSAAQLAWMRPATRRLSSTDIRELMTGKKISVGVFAGRGGGRRGGAMMGGAGDGISFSISGSPEDLETGLQLAYLLLTEPKIEPAQFEQFKASRKEALQELLKNPMGVGMRLAQAAPYPDDDPRMQPITIEQIEALQLDAAQAWLDKLIAESPIEVTIIGDIDRDRVMELAAKYLGALPARQRVAPDSFAWLRQLTRPSGPRVFEAAVPTPTRQAFVLSGFYGCDESNRPDVRALNLAARILSTRMTREVREEAQLVYSIGAASRPAGTFPGFGVFSAGAPTDPAKAQPLVEKLASMYERFAAEGPTEEELTVAKKQFAKNFEDDLKDPGFWAARINRLTFRGVDLDELMADPDAYQAMTAEQVRQAFAKYYSKDRSIVVVAKPAGDLH